MFTSLLITFNHNSFSSTMRFIPSLVSYSLLVGNTLKLLTPCFPFRLISSHPSIDIVLYSINSATLILHCPTSTCTLQYRQFQRLTLTSYLFPIFFVNNVLKTPESFDSTHIGNVFFVIDCLILFHQSYTPHTLLPLSKT